ncbi:MAG: efflux RND transporter permease subunit, partial [Parcubacteria group bacterium]|nr:efflux RND transporter permease subunit [Parcubacteria group bacterium]
DIAKDLRDSFKNITNAKITVNEASEGPPSGAAVEVRVIGDNLGTLDKIAGDIRGELEQIEGAVEVDTNIRTSPPEFGFKLKHEELGRYNLTAGQVAATLRSVIYGAKASTISMDGEDIDIRVSYPEESVDTVEELKNMRITTPMGTNISLSQVADFQLVAATESISHRNLKRIVSVTAKAEGRPAGLIFTDLEEKLEGYDLPEGYEIIYGGEMEQLSETFAEIGFAMILAVLLILLILILEFDSFKQPLIIMVSLPAAMVGVVLGLYLLGLEFGFAAFLGLVGLAGIVVNDAIVLIDRINSNIKERGLELVEAISEAGEARLEPIFLTTVTTIAGILPLYFADEFWRGLSIAMAFGLAFSTILTLTLIPVVYRWLMGRKVISD